MEKINRLINILRSEIERLNYNLSVLDNNLTILKERIFVSDTLIQNETNKKISNLYQTRSHISSNIYKMIELNREIELANKDNRIELRELRYTMKMLNNAKFKDRLRYLITGKIEKYKIEED